MNKENNKKIVYVLICIGLAMLLLILVFIIIYKAFISLSNNKNITKTSEVVRKTDETSIMDNLYTITCEKENQKKYNGYAKGDIIDCTIRYNNELKNFDDSDAEFYEMDFNVNLSKSLSLKSTYVTGPFNNKLDSYIKTEIKDNNIKIKNTKEYGNNNGTYCDIKYYACEFYYNSSGSSRIQSHDYEYNNNSIKAIEVHLKLSVQSNLSEQNNIKIDLSDNTTSIYHFKEYSIKPYTTQLFYDYDISNNDKYYVDNKTVYEFINNSYTVKNNISCKEASCGVINTKTINLGYIVINEEKENHTDVYKRLWNIENNEDYRTYKELFVEKEGETVYLIGNQIDDNNTYTITRLNDKQEINRFTISNTSNISAISIKDNKIVISISGEENKEYDIN